MGNNTSCNVSWHDLRDMSPPELADLMVRVCDPSFEKHHQTIIDHAVGGGIVCALGAQSLRAFLMDITITLRPQQDFIVTALDELRRTTEVAVAALKESGSPYKHSVVRNLRTHHAAYVTFTKEGDTFRGATKFTKSLKRTIDSAYDPPNAPVNVRLRGSGTLGVAHEPLLDEVAQSLNVVWLVSTGSLLDPFCLMEVCAAVRQGTPVLPVRLAGAGMRPLNLPIWDYSIAPLPSVSERNAPSSRDGAILPEQRDNRDASEESCIGMDDDPDCDYEMRGREHGLANVRDDAKTAAEAEEKTRRLRRRAAEAFYAHLARSMPKHVQLELHRNRFLVRDVVAAVRECFERASASESAGDTEEVIAAAAAAVKAKPSVFDVSAPPSDHDPILAGLVGIKRRAGERDAEEDGSSPEGEVLPPLWNWERVPRNAPVAGQARINAAVPWRTDEEVAEIIRMEGAEADDLAGLLVNDMLAHPGSENHQWEGCKGLADLAARDSDGLSAVRRQGGIQALLTALSACPKDADVQRWGCQALVPLFGDSVVATPFRKDGVAVVIRALSLLQDVETALKGMGAVVVSGTSGQTEGSSGKGKQTTALRERWVRAVKKVEVGRVKEQRRASLKNKDAVLRALEKEEAELAQRIAERRKSFELELEHEIDDHATVEMTAADPSEQAASSAPPKQPTTTPNSVNGISSPEGSATGVVAVERDSVDNDLNGGEAENTESSEIVDDEAEAEEEGESSRRSESSEDGDSQDDGLAEEQRRLEELDRLEHEAEIARLKKKQKDDEPDPWAMADADIAVYDKAFVKQDKDNDGFISIHEAESMFDKARASKQARQQIWELCDPHRRGKLSKHGWRVAFHLARSMKSRNLELPETLPQCLYPPGAAPAVSPLAEAKGTPDGSGTQNVRKGRRAWGERGKDGQAPAAEGVAVADGGGRAKGLKSGGDGGNDVAGAAHPGKSLNMEWKGQGKGKGKRKGNSAKNNDKDENSINKKVSAKAVVRGKDAAPKTKKNAKKKKKKGEEDRKDANPPEEANLMYQMSDAQRARYENMFHEVTKGKTSAKIGGSEAAAMLAKSGLSKADLGRLWELADIDRDGQLCRHEFTVAMHLAACAVGKAHLPLPDALPPCLAADAATAETAVPTGAAMAAAGSGDDSRSVVSSLGYPEGLSDAGGSELGDVTGGDNDSSEMDAGQHRTGSKTGEMVSRDRGGAGGDKAGDTQTRLAGKVKVERDVLHERKVKSQEPESSKGAERKEGENEAGERRDTPGAGMEKVEGSAYRMSGQDAARYAKAFDKLVKGKDVNLGGKEAAAFLAKSGLGKKELGRLWALSDADQDGALSRLEFSVAMHLASCSSKKGLPVPSALSESLAALLLPPKVGDGAKGTAGTATGAEATVGATAEPSQRPHELSADFPNAGHSDKSHEEGNRSDELASKMGAEAARHRPAATAEGTGTARKEGEIGGKRRSGRTGGAAAAEIEKAAPLKKRGFGMISRKSSAASPRAAAFPESGPPAVDERGGKRKRKPSKGAPGAGSKTAAVATSTTASTSKRENSPTPDNIRWEEAGRKALTSTDLKEGRKESRSPVAEAEAGEELEGRAASLEDTQGAPPGKEDAENAASAKTLEDRDSTSATESVLARVDKYAGQGGNGGDAGEGAKRKPPMKKTKLSISREERDQLYAMTTSERAGYDVVFMQVDADHSGTIDGREAAKLLGKSGLTREQLSVVWNLADTNDTGELDHHQWAVAMHLCRCVAQKHLPLPETLPKSLGGPSLVRSSDGDDISDDPDAEGQKQQPKGSKARREAEQAQDMESRKLAGRAIRMREQTDAFRLGRVTAAAFYITLAGAFGTKRHVMIPKVARSLPLDKARALIAAAGLGDEVLEDIEAAEAKLARLRRRRADEVNLHVKSTTSGATARDVQLLACRLANRMCATLDDENGGGSGLGGTTSVAVEIASAGGVDAVALIFRVFEAVDLRLVLEALQLALSLSCACAAATATDDSASETSSLASSSQGLGKTSTKPETADQPSPWLPLLRPLYAPSFCRKVAEISNQFPHSRRAQRLCCLLVSKLGSLNDAEAAAAARRCFAGFCDPCVAAVGSSLDEAGDSDGSSSAQGGGSGGRRHKSSLSDGGSFSPGQGVREVACHALTVLAREPGLRRRLVAGSAPKAVVTALEAAPRNYDVQLSCLETIAMLAEDNPGLWKNYDDGGGEGAGNAGRLAVKSVQTFVRDAQIHQAASSAILALLTGDLSENATASASRSVAAAGGATALCRVLATSPTANEVQLPAVLAINALLERCSGSSANSVEIPTIETGPEPSARALDATTALHNEFISAGACELLCKSAKTFPRDREIRVGCVKAMGALCPGAGATARLIAGGCCEQLMKTVDAYPDIEARRAGLALLVGIAEHGDEISSSSDDEGESTNDRNSSMAAAGAGRVSERLGFVGGVAFAAAWLRETTAPAWAWVGTGYGGGSSTSGVGVADRARDLLMSCKAAFLLTQHSSTNRDRLASMGAIEALSRAVALSGRSSDLEDAAADASTAEVGLAVPAGQKEDTAISIPMETQLWAAQALAELAVGQQNESRCSALVRCGALRALFAAMNKKRSARQLQRAGCLALGRVAASLKAGELQALGRNGGAQAVTGAFKACPGDKDVALAGLLAVAKLSVSSENRRLLGGAGACPLISKELLEFSDDEAVAEEGCRAVARLAALSGFNRTALGQAGAAEAIVAALVNHPSKPMVQRWGLGAGASLVAETDPSNNTDRLIRAGLLPLVVGALGKFRHNPTVQAEALKTFAKVALSQDGADAVWAAGAVLPTVRALGLYLNDADVQHWGVATARALTGCDNRCEAWRGAGACEAVVRALIAFGKDGTGRHARHDEAGLGRRSESRRCTAEESLCVQFQACAAAFNLAVSSPDARRRIVREGAGQALAGMMRDNSSDIAAQRGALAALAALSASGAENRKRLHRYKGGVPKAVVSALKAFPDDRRVRCEGVLTVQNLSLTASGARAMAKAGIAPVIIRLLRSTLVGENAPAPTDEEIGDEAGAAGRRGEEDWVMEGEKLDRVVLVYLLNGLANVAVADESLSDFVGQHGACQAVVLALEQRPRDLQLQASGVKAVRALALAGGRNVEVLAAVRGPQAIARAQGLFLRDREVQLACLSAIETLSRGENRANRATLIDAGSLRLLENALSQFASDPEVVSQGLRALVEIILGSTNCAAGLPKADDAGHAQHERTRKNVEGDEDASAETSLSLPHLKLVAGQTAMAADPPRTGNGLRSVGPAAVATDVYRAVETVLALLDGNPSAANAAFAALERLIVNLGTADSADGTSFRAGGRMIDQPYQIDAAEMPIRMAADEPHGNVDGGSASNARRLFQLAKVRCAVKRTLKIVGRDDVDLARTGGRILALIAVARGRALAQ